MQKTTLIMTCWKAYEPSENVESYIKEMEQRHQTGVEYCIALPFHFLKDLSSKYTAPGFRFGALHMNSVEDNSFTKLIAGKMLRDAGAAFVLIGSSFERNFFNETSQSISVKILEALNQGLKPILCVGENVEEYEKGIGKQVVLNQLQTAFQGIPKDQLSRIGVFFESPWVNKIPYVPSAEEVTTVYERDYGLLGEVVGDELRNEMEVLHVAPEDVKAIIFPLNRGLFIEKHAIHHLSKIIQDAHEFRKQLETPPVVAMDVMSESEMPGPVAPAVFDDNKRFDDQQNIEEKTSVQNEASNREMDSVSDDFENFDEPSLEMNEDNEAGKETNFEGQNRASEIPDQIIEDIQEMSASIDEISLQNELPELSIQQEDVQIESIVDKKKEPVLGVAENLANIEPNLKNVSSNEHNQRALLPGNPVKTTKDHKVSDLNH